MNRRRLLVGGSLAVTAGVAGCVGELAPRPDNDDDTLHVESDVWGKKEGPRPKTRVFGQEETALANAVGPAADEFEAFVGDTDFRASYLVLVQGIGVRSGTRLTLRDAERVDETLRVEIDVWPPNDDEPRPDVVVIHSLATRLSRDERDVPEAVDATVIRPVDRSVLEEIVHRF